MLATWNGGKPGPEFNNAAQVINHTFFWESMSPSGGGEQHRALLPPPTCGCTCPSCGCLTAGWLSPAPTAGKPGGKVAEAIEKDLGGYDKFVEAFKAAGGLAGAGWWRWWAAWLGVWADGVPGHRALRLHATLPPRLPRSPCLSPSPAPRAGATQFGSGWAWLSVGKEGKLEVSKTANAENPWVHGATPILTLDVW